MNNYKPKILKNQYILSVGNISLGGTGKTPVEKFLSELFKQKVNIITRGYKRQSKEDIKGYGKEIYSQYTSKETGDEAYWLAGNLPDSYFVITREKEKAILNSAFPYPITIIDDAFHQYKIRHNLKICVIDATNPFDTGKILPFGHLRHPLKDIKFAGQIWITKTNLVPAPKIDIIINEIRKYNKHAKILQSIYQPATLINQEFKPMPLETIKNKNIYSFCGIGNPEPFMKILKHYSPAQITKKIFADHHTYSRKEQYHLKQISSDYHFMITTEKDLVKFKSRTKIKNLYALQMKVDLKREE